MQVSRDDLGHERIATLDIETTSFDPEQGEVVAIGVGVHERGESLEQFRSEVFLRSPARGESAVVDAAYQWLNDSEADYLVTFNGRGFDFPFCETRLESTGSSIEPPTLHTPETHLDLFHDDRQALAEQNNEPWPGLEAVLEAYGETPSPQMWRGEPLDNTRFGDVLGPEYLHAVAQEDQATAEQLRTTIEEYLLDDLRKNLRIYYYDIGEHEPPASRPSHGPIEWQRPPEGSDRTEIAVTVHDRATGPVIDVTIDGDSHTASVLGPLNDRPLLLRLDRDATVAGETMQALRLPADVDDAVADAVRRARE